MPQSMTEASPIKWQLAHTTWFFETFLLEAKKGFQPFDPAFRVLFNSYYNAVGDKHPRNLRGMVTRPGLARVLEYRERVDARVCELLNQGTLSPHEQTVLTLGLHHEQQHQELMLTDLKHLLSLNPTGPAYRHDLVTRAGEPTLVEWREHPGGLVTVGHDGPGFAFDNEGPRHQVFLNPFAMASRPATNREYLEFVSDGGYNSASLWLDDGWSLVQREGRRKPLYWTHRDHAWFEFTLGGERPLNLNAPVTHLSYYEADAFAAWAGARLPTEFEWEAAAGPARSGLFSNTRALHPQGLTDDESCFYGSVWEWTRSAYGPYPGYRVSEGALGEYNGKFMSSQMVLRGGSCATSAGHIRRTYRNFFYPNAQWQFSGIRLAKDL